MKDEEGVMAVFLKSYSQKKENEDNFVSLDAFDEGKFHACFEVWHHQKQNFTVNKMAVSRFL